MDLACAMRCAMVWRIFVSGFLPEVCDGATGAAGAAAGAFAATAGVGAGAGAGFAAAAAATTGRGNRCGDGGSHSSGRCCLHGGRAALSQKGLNVALDDTAIRAGAGHGAQINAALFGDALGHRRGKYAAVDADGRRAAQRRPQRQAPPQLQQVPLRRSRSRRGWPGDRLLPARR